MQVDNENFVSDEKWDSYKKYRDRSTQRSKELDKLEEKQAQEKSELRKLEKEYIAEKIKINQTVDDFDRVFA